MELKGWYILCPKCKTLSKGGDWYERHTNVVVVKATLLEMKDRAEMDFWDESIEDTTRDSAWHDPCGFETTKWNTEDFAVYIEDNKIVQWGAYWDDHFDDLKKIAEEKGLKLHGYKQ